MSEQHISSHSISHEQYEQGREQRLRPHQMQDGDWLNMRVELYGTRGYLMRDSGLVVPDDIIKESLVEPTEVRTLELAQQ